ncbi:MAG: 50S ribosomal protein L3 [Firmicutes bacterium]|nr:50S ribosomal protein L3 [Bacillota bacterium]
MDKAILGKKLGMTQIFDSKGLVVPVTVIEAGPVTVVQKKTMDRDGYEALQVAFLDAKESRLTKAEAGHFKKANVAPKRYLKEFKLPVGKYEVGTEIKCDIFADGDKVDVSGTSKGHGFTGSIKKWNFGRLKMSHGTGPTHRSLGSTGANSDPSKVIKGKKMAGQWGNEKVTIQNLEVVKVDTAKNVLLVRGAVPGPIGGLVTVIETVK